MTFDPRPYRIIIGIRHDRNHEDKPVTTLLLGCGHETQVKPHLYKGQKRARCPRCPLVKDGVRQSSRN